MKNYFLRVRTELQKLSVISSPKSGQYNNRLKKDFDSYKINISGDANLYGSIAADKCYVKSNVSALLILPNSNHIYVLF